jgi:predicted small lipoprotein YifL
VSFFLDRPVVRVAAVCAMVAALGLSACGRKGPLELPPGTAQNAPAGDPPVIGPDGRPIAAAPQPAPKKPFVLDPLLN